jgi:putative copper export protein
MSAAAQLQLADSLTILRLSLHVLAASVWIGGQFVMAGLVPTVRGFGEDAPRTLAKTFARLSWPAYWLLIITGVWNFMAVGNETATSSWDAVFGVKMLLVVGAGLGALIHTKVAAPRAKGIAAGVGMLCSIGALVLGIAIAG